MFISLHANASLLPEVRGATVYYLDADAESSERPAGRGAVLSTPSGGSREIDIVPWELAQTRFVASSAVLAEMVGTEIQSRTQAGSRAVERAPLRVLVGANMPAVLVEMGYLSNAEEEQLLASAAYQAQLVQALLEAIVRFRAVLGQSRQTIGTPGLPSHDVVRRTP